MCSPLTILTLVTMAKTFAKRTNVLEEESENKLDGKDRGAKHEPFKHDVKLLSFFVTV